MQQMLNVIHMDAAIYSGAGGKHLRFGRASLKKMAKWRPRLFIRNFLTKADKKTLINKREKRIAIALKHGLKIV